MTQKGEKVTEYLKANKIPFELTEHKPVYTIDDMLELNLPHADLIAKNLFVRDDKKRDYLLLVVREDKKANLKDFRTKIGSRPLTFASEEDLNTILLLEKGSVTPFGVLNDEERRVRVFFDEDFRETLIGVHPNENIATVWIKTKDLIEVIKRHGNDVEYIGF